MDFLKSYNLTGIEDIPYGFVQVTAHQCKYSMPVDINYYMGSFAGLMDLFTSLIGVPLPGLVCVLCADLY